MAGMLSRAHLSQDMADIISQAHAEARRQGFSIIMVGGHFAVITLAANLEETVEGFCPQLVDSLMDYRQTDAEAVFRPAGNLRALDRRQKA